MIASGEPAPEFTLSNQDGEDVSLSEYRGRNVLLIFYPMDFSPVCSDQLSVYQEAKPQIDAKGIEMLGISVDHPYAHKAFQAKIGTEVTLLSDFEPKGEVARAYGSYLDAAGFANRTLVLVGEDGNVTWAYESPSPGEFPSAELILDAI